jgi:hypothetical protein
MKKACLISGGGAWGAFGGGTLAKINGDYDTLIGVSTGSLLAPLVGLKEWELLKDAYTSVDNDDIFDKCWYKGRPLTKDGRLRKFPIMVTLLLAQNSICTSNALRRTINRFFTIESFDELRAQKKEVLVGTQNFAQVPSQIHYFSSLTEDYEEFKDWMWCSANFPFFTSLVKKSWKDYEGNFHVGMWSDGGLTDLVGLDQLSMRGYKEIDIILHRTKKDNRFEGNKIKNLMGNVTTSINTMRYDIEFEYFYDKIKRLNRHGAKVRVFWLPRKPSPNSMVFNKTDMSAWWDEGYETAFDENRVEVFMPTKRKF